MDINTDKLQLRQMTPEDGERGAELVKKIGWSQSAATWEQTIRWSGDGGFCLTVGDELIATVIVMTYGTDLAWIGMVVTHPDYRRQGLAQRMMEVGLDYAQKRGLSTIMLDASAMGYPLYVKLGFRPLYKIEVFEGEVTTPDHTDLSRGVRTISAADIPGIIDLDARIFGVQRPTMIYDLVQTGQGWVIGDAANIEGYLIAKPSNQSISIGPWYHANPEGAEALFTQAIAASPQVNFKVHIPETNSASKQIASRYGLQYNRSVTRMVLSGKPPGEMNRQYSVAALATG